MRILLLHNRYRAEGGEERAVADIAGLLARRGHQVEVLERSSAATSSARAARGLISGGIDPEEVSSAVTGWGADVLHAHNVHPLFGWRSLAAARRAGARTVLHLHNFRLFCAISIAYRDGAPCFRCRGANTLPGLRLRCRGSWSEAAVYAAGLHRQQRHLFEHTDRFVAVSQPTATRLLALGLPGEGVTTVPNFVASELFARKSRAGEGRFALVSGRLVEEKGFDTAILAARQAEVPLVVAGEGPDQDRLRELAAGGEVRFTGRLPPEDLADLRLQAGAVLAPSRWEEPCPYSVLDACAAGVPALVSDRGGLPELAVGSAPLAADDVSAWTSALRELWNDPGARADRGEQALALARERWGEERYYERLMRVYES